jgi:hypothetical protein
MGLRIDDKGFVYGVKLREDAMIFSTFLKVDSQNDRFVWTANVKSKGPYDQFNLTGNIPFKLLDTMVPQRKLKGHKLYEFILATKDYHKLVRTTVVMLLRNDLVPCVDEKGELILSEGEKTYQYANAIKRHSDWSELIREFRPPSLSFQPKKDYQGAQYIDTMMSQISKKTFLRVNNGYYDGLESSPERDAIRSKMAILEEYMSHFPSNVIIVTGVEEEGLILSKLLATYSINSIVVNERSASNHKGFHIWMKEKNIEKTIAIGDKLTVKPIVAKDGAILRAIYNNDYAYGFGFMTNLLVHHYEEGNVPTSTAVGTSPTEYCFIASNRKAYFKQLPSRKPLHYYPYVYHEKGLDYPGTNEERLKRTWYHMWNLLSYPRTKLSYISRFKIALPTLEWRKGKDILDYTIESEEFKEVVQVVKDRDDVVSTVNKKIVGKQRIIENDPGRKIVQLRPPPPRPANVPPLSVQREIISPNTGLTTGRQPIITGRVSPSAPPLEQPVRVAPRNMNDYLDEHSDDSQLLEQES